MTSSLHPLDEALALTSFSSGEYTGQTHPGYWNMVGPFGGATAATLLQAILLHPDRLGDPLSLTVNYAGALVEGTFTIQAVPVRTNRSTQHWTLSILQPDAEGAPVVTTTSGRTCIIKRATCTPSTNRSRRLHRVASRKRWWLSTPPGIGGASAVQALTTRQPRQAGANRDN